MKPGDIHLVTRVPYQNKKMTIKNKQLALSLRKKINRVKL